MQQAGAVEIRGLRVELGVRGLVGDDVELVELVLVLIEPRRVEVRNAEGCEGRRLAGIVRDLECRIRHAAHEGEAALRIDPRREIEKALLLVGAVVDRIDRRRRVLDAEIVLQKAARQEILRLPGGAAIFHVGRDGAVAAAIDADHAGIVEGVGLGGDVEHAGRPQAVLGRQCAGEQAEAPDDAGVEDLPECADAVGKHDAVDAILQIGVLVADMQVAARGRILRDAGELQHHLVERGIAPLRQRLDGLARERVGRGSAGRQKALARRVEPVALALDGGRRLGLRPCLRARAPAVDGDADLGAARRLRLLRGFDFDRGQRGDGSRGLRHDAAAGME
jgi:hypothetical protein